MKRKFKILLDIIMLLMMLTLFSKQFISMKYHEIAGLVLIAVIIIHIVVNIKTVTAMCKKFIKIPLAVKAGLIIDILLLLCFTALAISGVLISHTILTWISSDNVFFKMMHMFAGGVSVILLGIHIGLHICYKKIPVIAGVILSVLILWVGVYGIANSSEIRWLTIPFTSASTSNGAPYYNEQANSNKTINADPNADNQESSQQSSNITRKNRQPLTVSQKIQSVVMFLGMILSCTVLTYWIAKPKKKKQAVRINK